MADEFDPLKQTAAKPSEDSYSSLQKNSPNNDDDLLRPPFEAILKTQQVKDSNNPRNLPIEQPSQSGPYHRLDFTKNASKAPVRPTNPFDEEVRKSPPTSDVIDQLPQGLTAKITVPEQHPTHATEQRTESNRESGEESATGWNHDQSNNFYGQDYRVGPPPTYYPDEYYEEQGTKKKGFAATMGRLVQRISGLGLLYKQSPADTSEIYANQQGQEYVEEEVEGDEAPELVDENQVARELTADELALNERYSNKLRTQIVRLQKKEQTQPVDVRIHHQSYTIYLCDVGRSVIEVFDLNGKLQHVIDDPTTIKFQPTAIAVAEDGTIIVASHFNHCLHLYSPVDPQETEHADHNGSLGHIQDGYYYKQYKLGSPGHDLHQFQYPAGIAIDFSDGYLYVCDRGNFRVQVMRPEGICERAIELFLNDEGQAHIAPLQIAHQQSGDQIVCIVGAGDAICFLSKHANGPTYVDPLYIIDNDGLGLQGASGLTVDNHDRIFISDTGHHRIVICTPEGAYITHFGTEGDGPGHLKRPCGLDITTDGTVVVADAGNKRLQLFGSMREQTVEENKPSINQSIYTNSLLVDTENANTNAK